MRCDAWKRGLTHGDVRNNNAGLPEIECRSCQRWQSPFDMYRCWDCGMWLCKNCVADHFSNRHEPHPIHLHEYEGYIWYLEGELEQRGGVK